MNYKCRQWICLLLCFVMLLGMIPMGSAAEHIHFHEHDASESAEHEHDHPTAEMLLLSVCEDIIGGVLGVFALPVSAAYDDGVECDYCGAWRYDDWKCDNGDHCGEGSGTFCYEEHHCGYCGACDDDHELCDDCGNCLEEHCECEDKCRGCYEMGETVCADCGEKCSGCAWVCDECEKCLDCVGDELYCSGCDICFDCADWICYCGEGCSRCAISCPDCREVCSVCDVGALCQNCYYCFDCRGGEGNYCTECQLCIECVDAVCYCGGGCSECTLICRECNETCENCADGGICEDCGICMDCVGGDGNFCINCSKCKNCVDMVCASCSEGCSECTEICPGCGDKCMNCADDEICSECGVCFNCKGGEGNYCAECGVCKDCVEMVCICGCGCSDCTDICPACGEKCMNCADDEICSECGVCFDCVGGEGNYCVDCGICKNCVDTVCICGEGCSDCADICPECAETCSKCADEALCVDCGVCSNCVGEENFCAGCGLCYNCVEMVCICGGGCSNCTDVCPECGEKCANCADGELCTECGKCMDCADTDSFCIVCGLCSDCGLVCPCGEGCEICADLCPDCGQVCTFCCDAFCSSCDRCIDCADDIMCEDCLLCGDCADLCTECGLICNNCAESVCSDCGRCADCMDDFCPECGICSDCADAMCADCHYCGDCADAMCENCREYCSSCAKFCEECGLCESCSESAPNCDHALTKDDGHRLMEWVITRKPGYTYTGEKQRSCKDCHYIVTEVIPKLTLPKNKYVVILGADAVGDKSGAPVVELLSKGTEPKVPALPKLSPDKNGTPFYGWADKTTGRTVRRGDTMTKNITVVPVWRECMEVSDLPFVDVKSRDYFAQAVVWAYQNEITKGTSATTFSPDATCTRAEVVTFLWRAAGCPEPKSTKNPFTDVKQTYWFFKPVLWAVEQKITQGTSQTTFTPTRKCSTAEILTFLFRAVGAGSNGYYAEAASWAESLNLVKVTGLQVEPTIPCPRKAIVSFLYGIYG